MRRRSLLLTVCAVPLGLTACAAPPVQTFPTLAAAVKEVQAIAAAQGAGWRSSGAFGLAKMLEHAAQSVEFSLRGYPALRSAAFRHTVGSAAFAVFDHRGRMSHGLDEPIPGAPALAATEVRPAAERLLKALADFDAHGGALAPHFAYGELDKNQYTRAHLMHLANHWAEVQRT